MGPTQSEDQEHSNGRERQVRRLRRGDDEARVLEAARKRLDDAVWCDSIDLLAKEPDDIQVAVAGQRQAGGATPPGDTLEIFPAS